jgi:hypothetical protein
MEMSLAKSKRMRKWREGRCRELVQIGATQLDARHRQLGPGRTVSHLVWKGLDTTPMVWAEKSVEFTRAQRQVPKMSRSQEPLTPLPTGWRASFAAVAPGTPHRPPGLTAP